MNAVRDRTEDECCGFTPLIIAARQVPTRSCSASFATALRVLRSGRVVPGQVDGSGGTTAGQSRRRSGGKRSHELSARRRNGAVSRSAQRPYRSQRGQYNAYYGFTPGTDADLGRTNAQY